MLGYHCNLATHILQGGSIMTMLSLSKVDLEVIESAKEEHVLVDIDGHKLDPQGVILVSCADGHQFPEIFKYKTKIFEDQGCVNPCIHTFSWNGGALRLWPHSPTNRKKRIKATYLVQEIRDAHSMKGLTTTALYTHAPCGSAKNAGMDLISQFRAILGAKLFVKKNIVGLKVACFLHVDYGNNRKKTHFVQVGALPDWSKLRMP